MSAKAGSGESGYSHGQVRLPRPGVAEQRACGQHVSALLLRKGHAREPRAEVAEGVGNPQEASVRDEPSSSAHG